MKKLIKLVKNDAGGIDLITEKDSRNEVRILTGNMVYSKNFWERMNKAVEEALWQLSEEK